MLSYIICTFMPPKRIQHERNIYILIYLEIIAQCPCKFRTSCPLEYFILICILSVSINIPQLKITRSYTILLCFFRFILLPDSNNFQSPYFIQRLTYKPFILDIVSLFLSYYVPILI